MRVKLRIDSILTSVTGPNASIDRRAVGPCPLLAFAAQYRPVDWSVKGLRVLIVGLGDEVLAKETNLKFEISDNWPKSMRSEPSAEQGK